MNHKHSYRLLPDRSTYSILLFQCQDHHCNRRFYIFKYVYLRLLQGFYRIELMAKPAGIVQQYIVKERP